MNSLEESCSRILRYQRALEIYCNKPMVRHLYMVEYAIELNNIQQLSLSHAVDFDNWIENYKERWIK